MGLGILQLGIAPGGEEVARSLWFLLVTIFYGGVWLALALMFSTIFRQPATAALAAMAIWLFFTIFWSIIANLITEAMIPDQLTSIEQITGLAELNQTLNRVSPNTLYVEATTGLLLPDTRSFGIVLPTQMEGAILGAPLPVGQSALLIWPHLTGLVAITVLLFAIAYVFFQRQEIRA